MQILVCFALMTSHFQYIYLMFSIDYQIKSPKKLTTKTRGPWIFVLCMTPAIGATNGNFLQTYVIVAYSLAPLQGIRLRNLTDLEFDLSRSLKVICDDVIGLSIYAFLLYSNYMSNFHRLALMAAQKFFSYLLSLGPNYEITQVHRMTPK